MLQPATEARPTLIVLGGLPGSGKSTLARHLAASLEAVYLRIDTIEQAIRAAPGVTRPVDEEGYRVAFALARDNLLLGRDVISDSVNPVQETRDAWREVAADIDSVLVEIEVVCSNLAWHRLRVETRASDIPGLQLPSWEQVTAREYEPWTRDHVVVDTGRHDIETCVAEMLTAIQRLRSKSVETSGS